MTTRKAKRPAGQHPPPAGELGPAEIRVPDIQDLAKRLRFAPQQGRIWLDDQRMMLWHVSSMGVLRQELIESLGKETARGLITRIGYQAGARDAEMTRKVRAGSNSYDDFLAGPQLVSLEGIVHCVPNALAIDVEKGHYYGDFYLVDCAEAETHIASYGIGNEPVCWMLLGYACGFTSTFMGRPILWREIECRSMGHDKCRVVGKPVEEWEDAEDDLRFLQIGDFVKWGHHAKAAPPGGDAPPDPGRRATGEPVRHGRHFQRLQHGLPHGAEGRAHRGHRALSRRERRRQGDLRQQPAPLEQAGRRPFHCRELRRRSRNT